MQIGLNLSLTLEHGGAGAPTLDMTFTGTGNALDSRITFTRASNATQFNSAGVLVYAPNNWIRNNTMQGAVAGTPGTLPTNWAVSGFSGLTREIVGVGVFNGVTYVDIKYSGTSSGVFGDIYFEGSTVIAATNSQSWAESAWVQVVAGTQNGVSSINLGLLQYDSGGVALGAATLGTPSATISTTWQRINRVGTTNNASIAFVRPQIAIGITSGVAIDITLRIGLPQLEIGPVATAVNPTSGTAYQGPRLDYDPSTLAAQGLRIEEQRTNSIRNNTMQGAVAGTPGTVPTNWSITGTANGLTRTISTGTENGITYIDVRYAGTTTAASFCIIRPEAINQVAAASGQSWTSSLYMRVAAGSTANITGFENWIIGADAGGVITESTQATPAITGAMTRFAVSRTMNNASTAFVYPYVAFTFNNGAAIDITLRIGLPQLEQGAFATSVIPTTTTALTRSADVASVNTLSPWYNASAGTLFAEFVWEGLKSTSGQAYAQFDDGSTNNRIVAAAGSSNANIMTTTSGGTSDGSVATPATVFAANTIYKTALALAANDLQSFVNGTAGTADTTVTLPVGLTNFKLGASLSATANVWLRRATYYPRRLSQAEGIAITA